MKRHAGCAIGELDRIGLGVDATDYALIASSADIKCDPIATVDHCYGAHWVEIGFKLQNTDSILQKTKHFMSFS